MRNFLLGIDIGTTNVKAVLFEETGRALATGHSSYTTYYPGQSAAEQDAEDWWESTAEAIKQIVGTYDMGDGQVAAISVSSQSATLLPIDEKGIPLRRGIIWMDKRAEKECLWLEEQFGKQNFIAIFGMEAKPFYLMPKLLWLKNHEPEIFKKTRKVLLTNSYINYKLTGVLSIDNLQAALTTQAYDITSKDWSVDLERLTDIPIHDLMPDIYPIHGVVGTVTNEAASKTGLKKGIPVVCGTTDAHASALEVGITHIGDAAEITGTSTLFLAAHNKPLRKNSALITSPQFFPIPDVPYMIIGPINASGASLKWYANTYKEYLNSPGADTELGNINVYDKLNKSAELASAGSGGLYYFPYLSGERAPLWNSYVMGMFIGLTAEKTQHHIARSIYEGTSFALKSVVEEAYKEGVVIKKIRSAGGGANSDIWLRIKASMLNIPVEVSKDIGGAPLGDAIIAGYGVGLYNNFLDAVNTYQRIDKVIEPVREWTKIYDDMYPLYMRILKSLDGNLGELKTLINKYQLK